MNKNYFVHESSFVDDKVEIGINTKIWHFSHIMSGSKIGNNCNIGQNVVISPNVILGNNVKIQNNVSVYTGVTCEDDVFLGPSMVFTNILNPRSAVIRRDKYVPTTLKKGCSIGANATIICGNTIGEYSMVGAGSVVTKDVLPFSLVIGNPAKHVGWISEYGHKLDFKNCGTAKCEESGDSYILQDNRVKKFEI